MPANNHNDKPSLKRVILDTLGGLIALAWVVALFAILFAFFKS